MLASDVLVESSVTYGLTLPLTPSHSALTGTGKRLEASRPEYLKMDFSGTTGTMVRWLEAKEVRSKT